METKDIIIIGGGAAGLMASCAAAHVLKKRGSVLVLEGNAKLGRKLLATGNGRCNLTNLNVSPAHYHGDVTAIQDLLHEYTPEAICAVFREMGLVTKPDSEGRVYPQLCGGMPKNTACRFRKNTPSQKSRKSKTDLRLSVRTARSFSQSSAF